MKKRKFIISTSVALLGSIAFLSSCAAPGSSRKINSSDPGIFNNKNNKPEQTLPKIDKERTSSGANKKDDNHKDSNYLDNYGKRSQRVVSSNFIAKSDKINYLALGDSLTAGFDGTLPKDYQGSIVNGEIRGLSYPAFLANILNDNHRVNDFNNYAISGATTQNWIDFLDGVQNNNVLNKKLLPLGITPEYVKNKLAQSNLITFTLGANDFFHLVFKNSKKQDIVEVLKNLNSKNPSYLDALDFVNKVYSDTVPEIKSRLNKFVAKIKEYAPNANINLVSYPTPLLGIKPILDQAIAKVLGTNLKVSPLDEVMNLLNDNLKEVAIKQNINFIDPYNSDFWKENVDKFSSIYFDIHPSTKGYKKIAQDIYLKITNPSLLLKDYNPKYGFNTKFLDADGALAKYQIAPVETPEQIFGDNVNEYLNNKTISETNVDPLRSISNYGKRLVDLIDTFNQITLEVLDFITDNSIYKSLDPQGILRNILFANDTQGADTFYNALLNSNVIQSSFTQLQAKLIELVNTNNYSLDTFIKAAKEAFFNQENLVSIITAISKSGLIQQNSAQFKLLIKSIIKNGLINFKSSIVNLIVQKLSSIEQLNISSDDLTELINNFIYRNNNNTSELNPNLAKIIDTTVDIIIDNIDNIKNAGSIQDIINSISFNTVSNNQKNDLALNINTWISSILKHSKVINPIANTLLNYLNSKFNIQANDANLNSIKNLIFYALKLNENPNVSILKNIIEQFLNNFDQFSFNNIKEYLESIVKKSLINIFSNTNNIKYIINDLSSDNTFKDPNTINLLKNIFKQLINQDLSFASNLIYNNIPFDIQNQLQKFINQDQIIEFLNLIVNSNDLKAIANELIDAILDNVSKLSFNTLNANEIALKTFELININHIQDNIKNILKNIFNNSNFKPVLKGLILSGIQKLRINSTEEVKEKFASDLTDKSISLINDLNLVEEVSNALVNNLNEAKSTATNQGDVLAVLAKLPNQILNILKSKFNSEPQVLISRLLNSDIIQQNKDIVSQIFYGLYKQIANSDLKDLLIKNYLDPLLNSENVIKFIDPTEVKAILQNVLNDANFDHLVNAAIPFLLSNTDLITTIASANLNDIASALFKDANFNASMIKYLAPVIAKQIKESNYKNTLVKLLKLLITNNNLALDDNDINNLADSSILVLKSLSQSNLIEQFISNLLTKLTTTKDLTQLNSLLLESFKDAISNLSFTQVNQVLKALYQDQNTNQLASIKKLANLLIDKYLTTENIDKLFSQISNNNQLTQASLNLLKNILVQDNTKLLIKDLVSFVLNLDTFKDKNITSFSDLIVTVLKNPSFLTTIETHLKELITHNLADDNFKTSVINLLKLITNNPNLSWIFHNVNETEKTAILTNIYDLITRNISQFNLVDLVINTLKEYANNDQLTNINDLFNLIKHKFSDWFNYDNASNLILTFVKNINQANITNHKESIKTIFNNVLNYLKTNTDFILDTILSSINQTTKANINQYLSDEDLKIIVKKLLNDTNVNTLLTQSFNKIIESDWNFNDINSFNDLIKLLISKIDFNYLINQNQNIWQSIFNPSDNDFIQAIKNIITNLFSTHFNDFYQVNLDQTNAFINNVVNNLHNLGSENSLIVKWLKYLNDHQAFNQTNDLNSFLTNIKDKTKEFFASEFGSNILSKIQDLLHNISDLDTSSNKEYLTKLVKYLLNKFSTSDVAKTKVLNLVKNILPESQYYNKSELINLIASQINNPDWFELISNLVNHLLTSTTSNQSNTDIIFNWLKNTNILEQNKNLIDNLIHTLLSSDIDRTLTLLINKGLYLIDEHLTINVDFARDLRLSIKQIIDYDLNQTLVDKIFNLAINTFKQDTTVDFESFKNNLIANLSSVIDFNNYNFVKSIVNSNLFRPNNQETLINISNAVLKKYLTSENSSKIIDWVWTNLFNDLRSKFNLNETNVKNVLTSILNHANENSAIVNLTNQVIKTVINNNNVKNADNYTDLIKALFSDNELVNTIKPSLQSLIQTIINDANFRSSFESVLNTLLTNSEYSVYFTGVSQEQKNALLKDALNLYDLLESEFSFSNLVTDALINQLAKNGHISINSFITYLVSAIDQQLHTKNEADYGKNIVEFLAKVAQKEVFTHSKDALITILKNIFAQNNQQLVNVLATQIDKKSNSYIALDDLKTLLTQLLNNQHFKNIFFKTLENVLSNITNFTNVTSLDQLIQEVLKVIDFNSLTTELKSLLEFILNNDSIKTVITNVIVKNLELNNITIDQNTKNSVIVPMVNSVVELLKTNNQQNSFIDLIINSLNNKQYHSLEEFLNTVNTNLSSYIQNNYLSIIQQGFKAVLNNTALDKTKLITLINQIFDHLTTNQTVKDFIHQQINAINSGFFDASVKPYLNSFIDSILIQQPFKDLVHTMVNNLINSNNNWIDQLNDPFNLIKNLITNQAINANVVQLTKNLFTNALNEPATNQLITAIVNKLLVNYHLNDNLSTVDKSALITNLTTIVVNYINSNNIFEQLSNKMIQAFNNSNNFSELFNHFINDLSSIFDLSNYQVVKNIFNSINLTKENQAQFKSILSTILQNIANNTEVANEIKNKLATDGNNIDDIWVKILELLKDQEFKNALLDKVFNNLNEFKNTNSYLDLIKLIVKDTNTNNVLVSKLKPLLFKVLANDTFANKIAKLVVSYLPNELNTKVFNSITEENKTSLIKNLLKTLPSLDATLNLSNSIISDLISGLETNNYSFNTTITQLKQLFNDQNNLTTIQKVINDLLNSDLSNNIQTIKTVISNLFNNVVQNLDVSQLVLNNLSQSTKDIIFKSFITQEQFATILNNVLKASQLKTLASNFIEYLFTNKDTIKTYTSFDQTLHNYFNNETNKTSVKTQLKQFIKDNLNNEEIKDIFKSIIKDFIAKLNLANVEGIDAYIDLIVDDLGNFLDRVGVLENLLNGLIDVFANNTSNLKESLANLSTKLLSSLNLSNYNNFKLIVSDVLFAGSDQHKTNAEKFKTTLKAIVTSFLGNENIITQATANLKLAKLVFNSESEEDINTVNQVLIKILNNTHFIGIVDTVIDDVVNDVDKLKELNSWTQAISYILKKHLTEQDNPLESKMYSLFKEVLNKNNDLFYKGLTKIVMQKMTNAGMVVNANDEPLINNVLKGALDTIVNSDEFKTIVTSIYKNIANVDYSKATSPSKAFIEAFTNGALSIVLNDHLQISFDKLLNQNTFLSKIITAIGDQNWVKFVNLLFTSSTYEYNTSGDIDLAKTSGIYSFIASKIIHPTTSSDEKSYGFKFDVNIFNIQSKVENLVKTLYTPIIKEMIIKATNGEYAKHSNTNDNKTFFDHHKLTSEYQALYRLNTFILWYVSKQISQTLFWNSFSVDAKGFITDSIKTAWKDILKNKEFKDKYDSLDDTKRKALGIKINRGWFSTTKEFSNDYVYGSSSTSDRRYSKEDLLVYIYYTNLKDKHREQQPAWKTILDSLKQGYLGDK
ncbi:hypothetical protein GE118_01485 [Mycoplasma sp. NEAQ87857]|uniref:SGNH/GDSL hydrolase family protein n=1 Tax=Mycoplasma sp. NEAQ87857 TaxID=2683967 RepID=UPI001315CA9D|nr:SGNH/GDSL hydrolase family protein [Mycoplasma sp. NEAQ87857]QGZ97467.1 hypothetical protein GE118_01485 [Mycoplasma sp. NEAQ87857]